MKKFSKLLVLALSVVFFTVGYASYHHNEGKTYRNIITAAQSDPQLTTFVAAVKEAHLTKTLQRKGPFTIYAPSNRAFSALPHGMLQKLMQPQNRSKLRSVLETHIVHTRAHGKTQANVGRFKTLNGATLVVTQKGSHFYVNNKVKISTKDIHARNGVIHIINAVFLPKKVS